MKRNKGFFYNCSVVILVAIILLLQIIVLQKSSQLEEKRQQANKYIEIWSEDIMLQTNTILELLED